MREHVEITEMYATCPEPWGQGFDPPTLHQKRRYPLMDDRHFYFFVYQMTNQGKPYTKSLSCE